MGNRSFKKIFKKTLSAGILANPRPHYNSNVAKVYIVKWSQNWIFVDGNLFFGLPYDFKLFAQGSLQKKKNIESLTAVKPTLDPAAPPPLWAV